MDERTVLCFGDSNTWGFVPAGVGDCCLATVSAGDPIHRLAP